MKDELRSRLGILAIFVIGISVGICLTILYQDGPTRLKALKRAIVDKK